MTREEEIEQAAKDIARKFYNDTNPEIAYRSARQGILYADSHPREGLVDIEKACMWLDENAYLHVVDGDSVTSLLEYFRKAMEE